MLMIVRYPSGRRVEGILLAASSDRMRIVVARLNETLELRLEQGQWTSEDGDPIEIDGCLTDGSTTAAGFCSRMVTRTSTATN